MYWAMLFSESDIAQTTAVAFYFLLPICSGRFCSDEESIEPLFPSQHLIYSSGILDALLIFMAYIPLVPDGRPYYLTGSQSHLMQTPSPQSYCVNADSIMPTLVRIHNSSRTTDDINFYYLLY